MDLLPADWITIDQAEEQTGYHRKHLFRLARAGDVEAQKLGREWLFHRPSLQEHKATARPGPKPRQPSD